jgi:hypothetical protein
MEEECLTSETTPDDISAYSHNFFRNFSNLTSINVESSNPNYSSEVGVLFDKNKTRLIRYPKRKTGSYTIPDSVIVVANCAFLECKNLTSVTIPDSVTVIGFAAFLDCKNLISVTIPDNVTTIDDNAFWGCKSLTSIIISDSVTSIGDCAFWDCKSLTSINVAGNNPNYSSEAGVLFDKNKTTLILCPQGKTGYYTIPDSVTIIGKSAFEDCKSLTSIIIPDSVTIIANCVFDGCKSLTSVTIPDSVTDIGIRAFRRCRSLTSVIIPESVPVIGKWTFEDCASLTSVTIPAGVTDIDYSAFLCCKRLAEIHNKCATPQRIDTTVFKGINTKNCTLYVPESAVAIYKSAPVWRSFANIVGEILTQD